MLDSKGFNLWAGEYDKSVGIADDNNEYPFAGYRELMNSIYCTIMEKTPVSVLDIGLGTGTLSSKLYDGGNEITGIDFSNEMLNIAKTRMPKARLIQHDFSKGLPNAVSEDRFDFIVSTYALHHLTDSEKTQFILSLLGNLKESGSILIGDVSFQTREDLESCKKSCGDDCWDNEEFYFVFSEISENLYGQCTFEYRQISHCCGIIEIKQLRR